MGKETELKSIFLPFLLFAMHGVDVTIITTPQNATIFQKSVDLDSTHLVTFPAAEVGLPPGIESFNADTPPEMFVPQNLHGSRHSPTSLRTTIPRPPTRLHPAAKLRIPRIIFFATSYLSRSAAHVVEQYAPLLAAKSDSDPFAIPGLPDRLEMTRLQLPEWLRSPNQYTELMKTIKESEKKSYGSVFNSFYDLEGAYYEHYKGVIGTESWGIGPVSLWANQDASDKASRGYDKEVEGEEGWHKWLNTRAERSVLYVTFGSLNKFPYSQLVEIARALEDSGKDFIWVVRKNDEGGEGEKFLEEFEKRMKESKKGYLIWGWAPQLLILENPAIGGLVTHCGWNTVVESMNAGLPMVTWPLFAEHFFNEKLVVDVLKIGVSVGAKEWRNWNDFGGEIVKAEDIGNAIGVVMSEKGEDMRRRAKTLSDGAKRAIEDGGSSYNNLDELIRELNQIKLSKAQETTLAP
ncbi:hypothetical protein V8G54_017100 [Vigna mungo]|uniref:Glycosyltransferase n=1 Tax=Vigna mungo TaxID=3915 RepID=A0AAQ3NLB8_VIGMU